MNKFGKTIVLTATLVSAPLALGLSAEVCYAPTGTPEADGQTTFECPELGSVTLQGIADQGFEVAQLGLVSSGSSQIDTQLIIQKPDRFFKSGFEI